MADSYVRARWQREGRRGKRPRLIVIHCTVTREMGTGAEAVARNFARPDARKGSTHLVADSDTVVRCVDDEDTAYGAAGANDDGLHVELIGMPQQSEAEWLDDFGRSMFRTAAPELREWMRKYGIPGRWLTVEQVRDGTTKGFTDHATVEKAFPSTGHWDPGFGFPHGEFMRVVAGAPGREREDEDMHDEVIAMFGVYFGLAREEIVASLQRRREVAFHAWQIIDEVDDGRGVMTLSRKRREFEEYARATGAYS